MKNKVNSKLEWIRNFFFDSRKDGADRIGVTANYLCQIETGTKVPRLKGLCKFSYAYGIPLDILFSDERRFLIYSIEAMSALSEKSEIDKLIEGLQCLQKSLTLQSQEDESQPGTEKQVNTASDWINTGNSYEIVRTDSPNGPKQRRRRHRSNIAKYRRRKGYTQATLSEAAGISTSTRAFDILESKSEYQLDTLIKILLYYRSFFCKEDETGDTPEGENLN